MLKKCYCSWSDILDAVNLGEERELTMGKIIFVALGGALGATCRYLIGLIPVKGEFPFLTLLDKFVRSSTDRFYSRDNT